MSGSGESQKARKLDLKAAGHRQRRGERRPAVVGTVSISAAEVSVLFYYPPPEQPPALLCFSLHPVGAVWCGSPGR